MNQQEYPHLSKLFRYMAVLGEHWREICSDGHLNAIVNDCLHAMELTYTPEEIDGLEKWLAWVPSGGLGVAEDLSNPEVRVPAGCPAAVARLLDGISDMLF